MGIDTYLRWKNQTDEETEAQHTGFDATRGDVGYLRESIGGVHAVTWLIPEAFADEDGSLDNARGWYGTGGERQMAEAITGMLGKFVDVGPGKITFEGPELDVAASGFPPEGYCVEAEVVERERTYRYTTSEETETWTETSFRIPVEILQQRLPLVEALCRKRYEGSEWEEQFVRAFHDFVALYAQLDAEGREPSVFVSY